MSIDESVSHWIEGLRGGDEPSAQRLWDRYFQRLVRLAGKKLPAHVRREFDEEDVALSAFHSLCQGVARGRFPDINDRSNLWSLLVVITARKVAHQLRNMTAQKRGCGQVEGESAFKGNAATGWRAIEQVVGQSPTPDFAVQVAEESERLVSTLPDESMRELVRTKMAGVTNQEAAQNLGISKRTIERRLALIRKLWIHYCDTTTNSVI